MARDCDAAMVQNLKLRSDLEVSSARIEELQTSASRRTDEQERSAAKIDELLGELLLATAYRTEAQCEVSSLRQTELALEKECRLAQKANDALLIERNAVREKLDATSQKYELAKEDLSIMVRERDAARRELQLLLKERDVLKKTTLELNQQRDKAELETSQVKAELKTQYEAVQLTLLEVADVNAKMEAMHTTLINIEGSLLEVRDRRVSLERSNEAQFREDTLQNALHKARRERDALEATLVRIQEERESPFFVPTLVQVMHELSCRRVEAHQ